ncbi:MAG: polysaccharide biosynthesis C-terminal domain-containing protein [Bacteroidia bacterium]
MRKKFLSDFFFIQVINLLIKPVWILVIDRKVQNLLPTEEYGTYFSLTGYSLLFMILLDLGLTNYNNREVAVDQGFYKTNFWSIIGAKCILTIVFFIAATIVGVSIGFTPSDFIIFGLLAFNQTLLSFNNYLRSNISAIHQFKMDGVLSIIDRLFVILSLGAIIWTSLFPLQLTLYIFILAQTAGLFLTFIVSWIANAQYLGKAEFYFDKSKVYGLLKKSLPYASIIALMTIYTRIDSVLILKLLPNGRTEAGNYAMSYRLLDAAAIIGALLAGQLLPLFASNLINKARLFSIIKWASLLVFVPALIVTIGFSVGSNFLMSWLYPEKYTDAVGLVFSILIWCIPAMLLVNIFGTLLTAAGHTKRINHLAIGACMINVLGNLIFINSFGLVAVAITAVITQVFFGVMCYWNSKKIYN